MRSVILAIDDDQPMLWLISKVLKDYKVVCKSDGLEAMSWLSKGNHPDLIILDREMPNLGGMKFLRGLRGSGLYKDIPVIFLSSWIDDQFFLNLYQLNVVEFIEKPFNPTYLVERVDHHLLEREVLNNI